MEMLMQMFSYPFIVRAFIVGILVSLCAALLGVSLVLKQYSMIGDGLSHVSYGALSIAIACGIAPLALSIPVVIVAAFFLLRMTENGLMKSDAAIAAMSASALAIGVSVTSLTDRNDNGCVQLHVWQHFGDDIRRRIFKRWFVCDRIVVIYLLLSQYLYGHFRRKLCQSNGGKGIILQYNDRNFDGSDDRSWNADDGSHVDIEFGYFSGTHIYAYMEKF